MIIEFYDRSVSTRGQDRRIGFLVKSGNGIVGTSREVFVENVKLARCRSRKVVERAGRIPQAKICSEERTTDRLGKTANARCQYYQAVQNGASDSFPRVGGPRSRRDGKRMEATEKRRCKTRRQL